MPYPWARAGHKTASPEYFGKISTGSSEGQSAEERREVRKDYVIGRLFFWFIFFGRAKKMNIYLIL
jgi:hypothetical protein